MSPDKEAMSITINITEGERFVVSAVRLEGDYLGRDDEFKSLVSIKPGEPYNADQVTATVKAFTEQFGNYGYAFASVNTDTEVDSANHRVAFIIKAAPSRRAYVRRINIEEEILISRVDLIAIEINADKAEIARIFLETGFSRLPVYEDNLDNIMGVLNQKDFHNYIANSEKGIEDFVNPVLFVAGSVKIDVLLRRLQQGKVQTVQIGRASCRERV